MLIYIMAILLYGLTGRTESTGLGTPETVTTTLSTCGAKTSLGQKNLLFSNFYCMQ